MRVYVVATHDLYELYGLNVDSVWTDRADANARYEELEDDDAPWEVVEIDVNVAGDYERL